MINNKVSVIIPNYNKEEYIEKCIGSVLKQTYRDIEIVVVDDCSTDNSQGILKKLVGGENEKKVNIKLIFLEKNGGVSNARNIGVLHSTGYYVTFLDSDDEYINNNKIENEVKLIQSDDVIAFSQWVPMDRDGKISSQFIAEKNIYNSKYAVCKILSISRPAYQQLRGYMITRKLFDEVGGYSFPYNLYEDFDFQIRLVLHGHLKYTYEYGEGYRDVPNGLSKKAMYDPEWILSSIQNTYYKELSIDQKIYYQLILLRRKIVKPIISSLVIVKHSIWQFIRRN